jgi:hypothetical protein
MATSSQYTTSLLPVYYVYILARPNGKPFYVGKGKQDRVFDHENEARSGCDCHKCRVIRKVWQQGGQIQKYYVLTTDDESVALEYERELIAQIGRKNLTNKTDGGDGTAGYKFSRESRLRMSAARKGLRHSEETRRKMGLAHLGNRSRMGQKLSDETRRKMREAHKGKAYRGSGFKHSEETRRKMSESQRQRAMGDTRRTFRLVAPDGVTHVTHNLSAFCREHGLGVRQMSRVLVSRGTKNVHSHRGWTYARDTETT